MAAYRRRLIALMLFALLGLGVSVAIEVVHRRLAADVTYTSFCNLSSRVNCDVVLGSRYASLFGVPVSSLAIAYYAALLALGAGVGAVARASTRVTLANATFVAGFAGLAFSVYMAVIAFVVLKTLCLMCTSLYVVAIGFSVVAWQLRSAVLPGSNRMAASRRQADRRVLVGGLAAAGALLAIGGWEAFGRSAHVSDAATIAKERPDFYSWFFKQPLLTVGTESRPVRGPATAAVTVVEFSDFECGHCAAFHDALEEVLRRDGGAIRVVFRHFPLDSACNSKLSGRLHPDACLAAVAAECAEEQGKFWEYHNVLFSNQRQLGREFLIGYAAKLGLDPSRFLACLGGDAARSRVQRDVEDGVRAGIDSTPTVFLNGRMMKGALDADRLADALVLARSR